MAGHDAGSIEAATIRLRRSYSSTPPDRLRELVDEELGPLHRLLSRGRAPRGLRSLRASAGWLWLLRATVLADCSRYGEAAASLARARALAVETGERELEGWSWETAAWIAATCGRQDEARQLATRGIEVAPRGGFGRVAVTLQRARITGAIGDRREAVRDLLAGQRAFAAAGDPPWPDDHYSLGHAKVAFFASGMFTQLGMPAEAIEHAAEVVRVSETAPRPDAWPMRTANARIEWATALADQGEEDAALAMAVRGLDPRWRRPDTERRLRTLLGRMRDARLRRILVERARSSGT